MAEGYETDDEQLDALKKWWAENGKSTLMIVVIAVVSWFGFKGWESKTLADINAASTIYQNMLVAVSGAASNTSSSSLVDEQRATANHLASTLKEDFPNSTYARFAALYKAKLAVESEKLPEAATELRWILENGAIDDIIMQTKLRLARVLYAQEKYSEAMAQLEGETNAYSAAYEEVRGDIYLAQGEPENARQAFEKAMSMNASSSANSPLLNLKIQQLNSQIGSGSDAKTAVSGEKDA